MILKFNGNLLDIMGDDARSTEWEETTGLSSTDVVQQIEPIYSLIRVVDVKKASKYMEDSRVEQITVSEANDIIDTIPIRYKVYNENLMASNLNQKVAKGVIDLDDMKPEWTDQEEAEFLYNHGISGINKSIRREYFNKDSGMVLNKKP